MELNQLPQAGEGGAPINNPMPPLQWYYVNAEGNELEKLRSEDIGNRLLKVRYCSLYRQYSFKTSYDLSLHVGQQRGPVISRMILHKWHLGEIDGFTLVYSSLIGEWKKISDVDILKEAISKIAKEEQIAEDEAKRLAEQQDQNQQVYYFDEDNGMQAIPMSNMREGLNSAASSGNAAAAAVKKSFTADNGLKYQWDDVENDWVEFEGPDSDIEDEKVNSKKWKSKKNTEKRQRDEDGEDVEAEEEEDDDDDGITAENIGKEGDGIVLKTKRKKKQKKAKGPNNWIYVSGLPVDVTLEEIKDHFSKMGLIAISAVNQQPKIKIYEDASGERKGDCALCYNAVGSVTMALDILHEGYIRPGYKIAVKRAEFQASSEKAATADDDVQQQQPLNGQFKQSRPKLSQAQVKVAKSAMRQALTWNEDDDMGVSKSKALKIVVMEGMFEPSDFSEHSFSDELEGDVATECGKCGQIEKITVFSKNPRGVVIVKFSTSYASQECVKLMDGRFFGGKKLRCYFWDGATDYTVDEEKEEEKKEVTRLDEFGDWLDQDQEDLPEEFRLNVER